MPSTPAAELMTSAHKTDDPRIRLIAAEIIPSSTPMIKHPIITAALSSDMSSYGTTSNNRTDKFEDYTDQKNGSGKKQAGLRRSDGGSELGAAPLVNLLALAHDRAATNSARTSPTSWQPIISRAGSRPSAASRLSKASAKYGLQVNGWQPQKLLGRKKRFNP